MGEHVLVPVGVAGAATALRVTGLTASGVFDGAIDGASFLAYIEQILVPTLHPGDIVIALVVGELQGGVGTIHLLESGLRTDAAIVPEPFGADNVVTTHAGVTEMAISTIGYSRHTTDRTGAADATDQMMKAIPAIKATRFRPNTDDRLPDLPLLNVGGIIGGRGRDHDLKGPNFTSDYCTVIVDVRFPPGQSAATVEEDIRALLATLRMEEEA